MLHERGLDKAPDATYENISSNVLKLLQNMIFLKNKITSLLFAILILVWLIGFLTAVFAPKDVLHIYPFLSKYVDFINIIFPVNQYASKSAFPQVALLYNAIILPFYPLYLVLGWRYWLAQTKGGLAIRLQKDIKQFSFGDYCFLIFFAIPLLTPLGLIDIFLFNGNNSRVFSIASSKLQLTLFSIPLHLAAATFLAGAALSIKKLIFGKI